MAVGVTATFSVTTAATQILATNTNRRGVYIESATNTASLYFAFGTGNACTTGMHFLATASRLTVGPLQPQFSGIVSLPGNVPTGDLSMIALTTTSNVVVTEW